MWLRNAISASALSKLDDVTAIGNRPGGRLALTDETKGALEELTRQIERVIPGARPVRLVSFDKSSDTNWQVPWHQDRVIECEQRTDAPGYSNWSLKAGRWHCEPPLDVLQRMGFVRLFLDDCNASNGGMEFALGSHSLGKVPANEAAERAAKLCCEIESAQRGDALLLQMLTLHRSSPRQSPDAPHRRVLRIDYG